MLNPLVFICVIDNIGNFKQEHGSILKWLMRSSSSKPLNQVEESSLAKKAKEERWSVWSLDGGLEVIIYRLIRITCDGKLLTIKFFEQRLPRTLHDKIVERNVKILLNHPCTELEFDEKGAEVFVNNGEQRFRANHVVSSLPANRYAIDHLILIISLI